jgi:hypothetical protein
LRKNEYLSSRFLCIGLSRDHDAEFLNQIARGGSELGNFFYVDTQEENYGEKVKTCLAESLNIAIEGTNPLKLKFENDMF